MDSESISDPPRLSTKYALSIPGFFKNGFLVTAITCMPKDFARFATSKPVAPKPMITSTFLCISEPKMPGILFSNNELDRLLLLLLLLLVARLFSLTFFAKYNKRKRVCSATETAFARGTFATNIDFEVQYL